MLKKSAATVAVLLALGGCTSSTEGDPVATQLSGSSAPVSTGAAAEFPERPASLTTADVDPCTLVPEAERAALEIDQPPVSSESPATGPYTGVYCSWSVSEGGSYGVLLSNDFTAQEFYEQARGDSETVEVGGFGAVRNVDEGFFQACYLTADTSDTSMALMLVNDRRGETEAQRAAMCDQLEQFAGVVLSTLQAQQWRDRPRYGGTAGRSAASHLS